MMLLRDLGDKTELPLINQRLELLGAGGRRSMQAIAVVVKWVTFGLVRQIQVMKYSTFPLRSASLQCTLSVCCFLSAACYDLAFPKRALAFPVTQVYMFMWVSIVPGNQNLEATTADDTSRYTLNATYAGKFYPIEFHVVWFIRSGAFCRVSGYLSFRSHACTVHTLA